MASSGTTSLLKGRWAIWILSLVFSVLAGFGVLMLLSSAAQQQTYYVINQDIAERTLITPDMLEPKTANPDGVPATALPASVFSEMALYSKVPLRVGDPLTAAVVQKEERIAVELPEGYVAVSLKVLPEDAVAGKIKAGDYIDIVAIASTESSKTSRIVLHHVLVLDVTTAPETIAQAANQATVGNDAVAPGPDSVQAKSGIPQLYTLAVSPENYATLALVRSQTPYLALSQGAVAGGLDVTVTETEEFAGGAVLSTSGDGEALPAGSGTVPEATTDGTVPEASAPAVSEASPSAAPSEGVASPGAELGSETPAPIETPVTETS